LPSSRDQALSGTSRPRGVLAAETFHALDKSGDNGWSNNYCVYRKTDGTIGHIDGSDAVDAHSLRALLAYTKRKLGSLADGILDGNADVSPYRLGTFSPCSWCPMAAACRFEMGISEVRFLQTLTRSEVFRLAVSRLPEAGAPPCSR
jgi:ATP-dependent helicase/nuclease subunit B